MLGRVIEVVSGKTLYQFEKENLLGPLGMTNTSFFVTDPAKQALLADSFPTKYDKLDRDPREVTKWESGGGGMVSSMADYARFVQMLLNRGELDGTRILARKTVDLMTSNHIGEAAGIKPWVYYFPVPDLVLASASPCGPNPASVTGQALSVNTSGVGAAGHISWSTRRKTCSRS